MTRSVLSVAVLAFAASGFAGCAMHAGTTTRYAERPDLPPSPYPGRAKIAVARFDWKVGQGSGGSMSLSGPDGEVYRWTVSTEETSYLGGLEDMLTTALVQSGYFSVLERSEFQEIASEIDLASSGYVDKSQAVEKGHVKGADILVVAAVTGWEPDASGSSVGAGGFFSNVLGGLKVGQKKAAMAIDIRLIDAATSEVIAAQTVTAESSSVSFGGVGGGLFGGMLLGGGLSSYQNTPMEAAIRSCIVEAVRYVATTVPDDYYRS